MIRAYLSHPIRGAKDKDATRADMEANNRRAIEFAAHVRTEFPSLDLYVPAEHDELVQEGIERGIIGTDQILQIDRYLLAKRDILIVFSPDSYIGGGVRVEIEEAQRLHKPIAFAPGGMDPIHWLLESFLR